jgi:membrane protein involved in colicin uptake
MGAIEMKGLKWQKFVGGVMAGLMTFSIMGTTLAVPAYAASYDSAWSEREHRQDVHKEMRRHQEKQDKIAEERRREDARHQEKVRQLKHEKEQHERDRYEREHRKRSAYDRYREAREREKAAEEQRKHDEKVQRNQKIAAAAIGAIVGAVIAKNT